MTTTKFLKQAFLINYLISVITGILKIAHVSGGQLLYGVFVVSTVIYIIIALYEIYVANRPTPAEKAMWTVAFVVLSTLAGFLYLINGRAKMQREYKILKR
ncbi:hypothetical protein EZJ43_10835 [Pedobacter changchengzhani]|uniref:Cardiolipin synthase N-terminal domain-containing protein n=1 Tax=Pedobacter changchengzhani TaxID=2529274 RepID=A0A4V3A011_9SPHI|nr:hypothetical protein [Pedobacter changchengzhani]TDG35843.1 hypothetical protein EZJ43_10835 [Pedobacter changchengzhani]